MRELDLQPLIEALEAMLETHTSLVELCGDKSRAIMQNNTAALAQAVKQENRLMHQSRVFDRKRGEIVEGLAQTLGVKPEDLTISQILEYAGSEQRDRLAGVQASLLQTLKSQKELNEKCRILLQTHMEYAEMVLNLMVGDEDPINNIYGASGGSNKELRQTPGLLDTKA